MHMYTPVQGKGRQLQYLSSSPHLVPFLIVSSIEANWRLGWEMLETSLEYLWCQIVRKCSENGGHVITDQPVMGALGTGSRGQNWGQRNK